MVKNVSDKKENPMREIMIEKVTLNVGVGEAGDKLEKARLLLGRTSGTKVVTTHAKKRIPSWNLRAGLAIGVKTTLRGENAIKLLRKLFKAVDNTINPKQFDNEGNLSFGIDEYIHIPNVKYDPSLGIIGLDVCVTLKRKGGFRTKRKAYRNAKIGKNHRITKEEAIEFFKKNFGVFIGEKKKSNYYY